MIFSSTLFLFRFLPITLLCYYIVPKKWKNPVILFFSLFFYSWGEVKYFPIMVLAILVNYLAALGIARFDQKPWLRRLFFLIALFVSLGQLFFFKYYNFFSRNIEGLTGLSLPLVKLALPLGISFYTFQTLTYTVDVYRRKVSAERNLINFATFVVLFPQLIAGPIVKYTDIDKELKDRTISLKQVEDGVKLFIFGLGKKVLIANNIGLFWTEIESRGFDGISTPLAWLAVVAFGLQIFFDFSGYSTMAIGLGKMLGFEFPQNFNYPYISRSITEFWRRWHMTLGSFFREYVYIPLGGNRKGKARQYLNLLIVWVLTGFWHGAEWNFILWGLYFFVFLVLEKAFLLKILEKHKIFSHIYLIFLILVGWAIFQITDMAQLGLFLQRMFAFDFSLDWLYYLRNYAVILLIGILFSTPLPEKLYKRLEHLRLLPVLVCGVILAVCVAYLVDASYNPFLYFRF